MSFFHKKSAKMSVFICENLENLLMVGGSAPRPPVAVVHIGDHSYTPDPKKACKRSSLRRQLFSLSSLCVHQLNFPNSNIFSP